MKPTVVTAYYEISSKFEPKEYWDRINNLCLMACDFVIFTSPDLVLKFKEIMKHTNAIVIGLELKDLFHYKFYNIYKKHLEMDYNKKHSVELYIVWAEKLKFVKKVINLNPFSTDKFLWCDAGAFRQEDCFLKYRGWPVYEKIVPNKMNFLIIEQFQEKDLIGEIPSQTYPYARLGGGIHGGTIDAWETYDKLWDLTLLRYFDANKFAGQDQLIMGTIYIENKDLFNIINHKFFGGDKWYYLLHHWS